MLELIGQIFRAIAEAFGFVQKRTDLNNTPAMVQRDEAQKEVNQDNDDVETISSKDLDSTRNKLS